MSEEKKTGPVSGPHPVVIPLEEGMEMISKFRQSSFFRENGTKGFYIPTEEITHFAKKYDRETVGVRAYLGIGEKKDGTSELKLIFVATLKDESGIHRDIIEVDNDEKFVYDLSTPCPTDCDPSSPLFDPPLE